MVQRAVDHDRRVVWMPPGQWDLEAPIDLLNKVQVRGSGKDATYLRWRGGPEPVFRNGTGGLQTYNRLSDFSLDNEGDAGAIGVDWDSMSVGTLDDLMIRDFLKGVDLNSQTQIAAKGRSGQSLYNNLNRLDIRQCETAVHFRDESNSNWCYGIQILGDVVDLTQPIDPVLNPASTFIGYLLDRCSNVTVHGGSVEWGVRGALLQMTEPAGRTRNNSFFGVRFERNGTYWETVDGNVDTTSFHGCYYDGFTSGTRWIDNGTRTHRFETPLGFFSQQGYTQRPSISGSRNGNAALTDLLIKLDNYGLIENQSTP